jgi:hypothetical protein
MKTDTGAALRAASAAASSAAVFSAAAASTCWRACATSGVSCAASVAAFKRICASASLATAFAFSTSANWIASGEFAVASVHSGSAPSSKARTPPSLSESGVPVGVQRGVGDEGDAGRPLAAPTGNDGGLFQRSRDLRQSLWEARRQATEAPSTRDRRRPPTERAHGRRWAGDVPPCLRHGPRGHRFQAARCTLPLRAFPALDQGQEPERARSDPRNGVTAPLLP